MNGLQFPVICDQYAVASVYRSSKLQLHWLRFIRQFTHSNLVSALDGGQQQLLRANDGLRTRFYCDGYVPSNVINGVETGQIVYEMLGCAVHGCEEHTIPNELNPYSVTNNIARHQVNVRVRRLSELPQVSTVKVLWECEFKHLRETSVEYQLFALETDFEDLPVAVFRDAYRYVWSVF